MASLIAGICFIIVGLAFTINPLNSVKPEKLNNMTPEEATKKYRIIGIFVTIVGILLLVL